MSAEAIARSADPANIEHWILQLVTAETVDELRTVGVAGCAAGHAVTRLECLKHSGPGRPVEFTAMVRHVRESNMHQEAIETYDLAVLHRHAFADIVPERPGYGVRRFPPRRYR